MTHKHFSVLLSLCLLLAAAPGPAAAKKVNTAKKSGAVRAAFEAGDNTLGIGIGVGTVWSYRGSAYPSFFATFDHGIISNVGPGTIGIGGLIGYSAAYYDYGGGYSGHWNNITIGARGTYHLTILKTKNNKFDPYGGVMLGFRVENYTDNGYIGYHDAYGGTYAIVGPFVGAKYNFRPSFGVFAEAGYDAYFLKFGLNFNF